MKKAVLIKSTFLITFLCIPLFHFSQSNNEIIIKIQELMEKNYVFLDKAKEVNAHLDQLMDSGFFEKKISPKDFANLLTLELQKITKDKHLRVEASEAIQNDIGLETGFIKRLVQDKLRNRSSYLKEVSYFEGNIGYMDYRAFGPNDLQLLDAVMQQLASAEAIIVDLRKNGGGLPATVAYLCSYFFEERLLLGSIYTRFSNRTEEFWTTPVNGSKRPEVPVFILTSNYTFSGAEDFSYTMQSRKRAQIIGEVTGGGAHPTNYYPIDNGIGIGIPVAMSINPITKTNWEGVGVIPDVKISADKALEKAKEMAARAIVENQKEYSAILEETFSKLEKALKQLEKNKRITNNEENHIFKLLDEMVQSKMIEEYEINNLGYFYLQNKKIYTAVAVFKWNTLLFPNSANTYDSYAESLSSNDQNELALVNYKKAVAVAVEQKDRAVDLFKENLKAFEARNE